MNNENEMRRAARLVRTSNAEFEALARAELRKFHIDTLCYVLCRIERGRRTKPLVVLYGDSGQQEIAQAWVYFNATPKGWVLHVDLLYGTPGTPRRT